MSVCRTILAAVSLSACGAPAHAPVVASPQAPTLAPIVAPPQLYTADEALRDALASPLQLVGVGGWYGYYRRLSCVYRNDRVLVVDERCLPHENNLFNLSILSPSRGLVAIGMEAREGTLVSSQESSAYVEFAVVGSAPFPAPLSLTSSYDEIASYEDARGSKFQPTCTISTRAPQGLCSHGSPFLVADFVAANVGFFRSPPVGLRELMKTLIGERARSYASSTLGKMSAGQIRAWGTWLGFAAKIDVAEESLPLVGNLDNRFAAIVRTDDGGIAYVGTRAMVGPVVARTNADRSQRWETAIAEPGYSETEETCLVATHDGFIAHVHAYIAPGTKARHRFVKLDTNGKVQWKWFAPNRDAIKIPQVDGAQLQPNGNVVVSGYIQLEKDGDVHHWTAEISADGKTLRDEIGAVQQVIRRQP